MKKFFSLLMATCVTFSMLAVTHTELGKKVDPNGHSWFHLKKHDGRADSALIGWYGIQKYLK